MCSDIPQTFEVYPKFWNLTAGSSRLHQQPRHLLHWSLYILNTCALACPPSLFLTSIRNFTVLGGRVSHVSCSNHFVCAWEQARRELEEGLVEGVWSWEFVGWAGSLKISLFPHCFRSLCFAVHLRREARVCGDRRDCAL